MSPIESKVELVVHSFDPNPYGAHVRLVNLVGKNKRVLDVGCTNVNLAEQLNRNGCPVVGIEVNLQSA